MLQAVIIIKLNELSNISLVSQFLLKFFPDFLLYLAALVGKNQP